MNTNSSDLHKKQESIDQLFDDVFELSKEEAHEFKKIVVNSRMVDVIKDLMKEHNIKTRKQLADKIKKSAPYITKVFRGDKFFNVDLIVLIEEAFNTTIEFKVAEDKKRTEAIDRTFKALEDVMIAKKWVHFPTSGNVSGNDSLRFNLISVPNKYIDDEKPVYIINKVRGKKYLDIEYDEINSYTGSSRKFQKKDY